MEQVGNLGNVYFVDYARIHHNPLNDEIYGIEEDITQIKENLLINGLQSPLEVVKEDGLETSYRLLSGHGRYDSLLELFNEGKDVLYQGKSLGNKIPCLLHTPFENCDAEVEYLLGGNVRKNRNKESLRRAAIKACEIYESKKEKGELASGETKRKFVSIRVGISERSVDKYIKLDDDFNELVSTPNKVKTVSGVFKSIDNIIQDIKDIQMDEYGKSDRTIISEKLDELILCIKQKKKEK